jgi:hypothetical protein
MSTSMNPRHLLSSRAPRLLCRGALALLLTLSVPASARDRDATMAEAVRYVEHAWQMKATNQKATCKADYKSDYAPGSQVGIPYAWGGSMGLEEFDRRIGKGEAAGSHSRDGILTCVAGVDCSGFVSQVWQLPQRYTTSSISAVTHAISLEELQPGDALNKAGSHIVLYAGRSPDGKPIIYEASGSASRVRMATPSWSYLAGYQPIRYNQIAAPATSKSPATASPLPPASAGTSGASSPAGDAALPTGVARVDAPAPTVPASRSARVTLRYGTDVGFIPGGEDAQAIGPDYLVAGPTGLAALYDRVRHQVLLLSRDGSRKTLTVENADGLDFTSQGHLAVLDGARRRILLFRTTGEPLRTVELPKDGLLGKGLVTLEEGILYVTDRQGQRRAIAELSDGRFKPIRRERQLDASQVLQWRERGSRFGLVEVGGEKLAVPPSVHVAARKFGPWIELTASWTDEQGRLRVRRTARRPNQILELPTAEHGAYAPLADLAVPPGGETVIYLEPAAETVSVVWADAAS